MDHVTASSGVILPVPPAGLTSPPLSMPTSAVVSRIDGYDFARALAVIGMTVVNYYGIFRSSLKAPLPFAGPGEFLSGRAAVLFVMLAGVGVTLLAKRPILAGDASAMRRFRIQIFRRCLVLFVMGTLFHLIWSADILHFYALFLSMGALCVTLSGRRLWLLVAAIWVTATLVFTTTLGDPCFGELLFVPKPFLNAMDDLLLGGFYAAFPFFSFLLAGIWFGRPEVINRPNRHSLIFVAALIVFVTAEILMAQGETLFVLPVGQESPLATFFENSSFPPSPLFALSAGAGAMMTIIFSVTITRLSLFAGLVQNLKHIGKLSLTIYIGHVCIGLAVEPLFKQYLGSSTYAVVVTCFTAMVLIGQYYFARAWCCRFDRGPLEWLLRRLSATG